MPGQPDPSQLLHLEWDECCASASGEAKHMQNLDFMYPERSAVRCARPTRRQRYSLTATLCELKGFIAIYEVRLDRIRYKYTPLDVTYTCLLTLYKAQHGKRKTAAHSRRNRSDSRISIRPDCSAAVCSSSPCRQDETNQVDWTGLSVDQDLKAPEVDHANGIQDPCFDLISNWKSDAKPCRS
ncbi:hypothetical protein BD289DRAFT_22625 [Coniella lustricola]|uniref:Uncharacterized protein n=1 Tax=Coniella lustricola TaxID=2025994 RepID=A0A2T3A3F5_9PEZI|nr:hypothetical protein BD289DRAFT_22625 [Coniella lustricola]